MVAPENRRLSAARRFGPRSREFVPVVPEPAIPPEPPVAISALVAVRSIPVEEAPVARPPFSIRLPVLSDLPAPAAQTPLPEFPAGDPFNPHKILNHFDRLRRLVRGELVYPITVEIDPTNLCNHRCAWCVSTEAHTGEKLGLERFTALVAELKDADVKSVVLKGGGEPTTHPQFIEMLEVLRDAGLAVGLITNGSMPRKGSVEKVAEVCDWARVSLDAATAGVHEAIHGTKDFGRILENIAALTAEAGRTEGARTGRARTMVGLNFVAEPRNHHEMADFTAMGKSLGAAYVTIRCVFDPKHPLPEAARDAMRAGAIAAKRMETQGFRVFLGNFTDRYLNAAAAPFPFARCMGPNLIGIVGGDAEVYACCFLRGNKAFSFGNIERQSFADVWKSDRRRQVMDAVYRGDCGRVCAGGMTANRYNTYNEILNYLAAEEKRHAAFA